MLADLDESLRGLLKRELARHGFDGVDIVFDAPAKEWSATLSTPTVNLFLYDLRESQDFRPIDWEPHRDENGLRELRPPLRVDVSYAVTAWTRAVEDEHRLLSQVLSIMYAYPELPSDVLLTSRLSDVLSAPPTAFLLFGKEAVDALEAAFAERYRGVLNVARGYSAAYPHYANVVHARASKGSALRLLCDHLGLDVRQAIAIGDSGPDISMFRVAGFSVAMANAPPEVQAEAQTVAPSNEDDGVAWALEHFVLGEA